MKALTKEQEARAREVHAFVLKHGGLRAASRGEGLEFNSVSKHYHRALKMGLPKYKAQDMNGRVKPKAYVEMTLPEKGKVKRYIFTSAQNNTHVHDKVWLNILALASWYEADIRVATFTYKKETYGKKSVKLGKAPTEADKAPLWYDPEIEPHICDEPLTIAPGLVWCGNLNILPTAVNPLSGLESYTGRKSGIFPHAKFAMQSIPSGKHEGTKFNYTTGTVTKRNYIAKKEGMKAEFHHGYGGLIVEVTSDGRWYVRQLNADSDGVIYDLDLCAKGGEVTSGHRIEAINWGDIHVGTVEPAIEELYWGQGGILDTLRPKYQFMHDTLNWYARSHHDMKNPHKMFERYVEGRDDVMAELHQNRRFLAEVSHRSWCRTVVVDSNHDEAMEKWLREADYRHDPKNAIVFLKAQIAIYEAIAARNKNFHLFEWIMRKLGVTAGQAEFLRKDQSFIICKDANGGIECADHGHRGPNGTRGNPRTFSRMGRKRNQGHTHSAGIIDGNYTAGITGNLDQGYNDGPGSWSQSNILTYANGKRAIQTTWGNAWRA